MISLSSLIQSSFIENQRSSKTLPSHFPFLNQRAFKKYFSFIIHTFLFPFRATFSEEKRKRNCRARIKELRDSTRPSLEIYFNSLERRRKKGRKLESCCSTNNRSSLFIEDSLFFPFFLFFFKPEEILLTRKGMKGISRELNPSFLRRLSSLRFTVEVSLDQLRCKFNTYLRFVNRVE